MISNQWVTLFHRARKDKRLPILIIGLCGLLAIASIVSTGKNIFEQPAETTFIATKVQPIERMPDISQWHLFGLYRTNIENLPQTNLQLTLEGTIIVSGNKNLSRALISTPGQKTKIYKIDDTIPGGAIIRDILNDRIILNYNGEMQSLLIPFPDLRGVEPTINRIPEQGL